MKVKKFRIKPRLPSVGKILKAIMGVKQLPAEIEESLPLEVDSFLSHVMPTAFYLSWPQEEAPDLLRELISHSGVKKLVAVSALVATVGAQPEEYMAEMLLAGQTGRSQVITALSEESADLSFQFLYRLLVDDAKSDDCEISEPFFVTEGGSLIEILSHLEAEQEGVQVDSAGHLSPRFTRVALVAWTPVSKKKHAALSQKKK